MSAASGTSSGASTASTSSTDGAATETGELEAGPLCSDPTRFVDDGSVYGPANAGQCVCALGADTPLDGGACTCGQASPVFCHYDAGQPPACVDPTSDPNNCGGCAAQCPPTAVCTNGTCAKAPNVLVPAAPGCLSLRVVYDSGYLYLSDIGHGQIARVAPDGSGSTVLVSGTNIAAQYGDASGGQYRPILFPSNEPRAAAFVVRAGTVYWIAAASTVTGDAGASSWSGGIGNSIQALAPGGAPTVLLPPSLAPGPSPVSASDSSVEALELPGVNPPIDAIALSPDGGTLFFSAGTRLYSIPATGAHSASDVTYVGFTTGPEYGIATALAAGPKCLYFATYAAGKFEVLDTTQPCDPDAALNEQCPPWIAPARYDVSLDTVLLQGGSVYWANAEIAGEDAAAACAGRSISSYLFPPPLLTTDLTGFAIGARYAYLGEVGYDRGGYIEKVPAPPYDGPEPTPVVIARGANPSSFALDGTYLYWTTSNCDIEQLADAPQ